MTTTTDTPRIEATTELLPLISRLAEIADAKSTLDAEEKAIKATLREHLEVGHKVTVNGSPVLSVQSNRRFDATLATSTLPPDLLELCTVPTVDSKRAKDVLPPLLYAGCCKEYEPRVVLL